MEFIETFQPDEAKTAPSCGESPDCSLCISLSFSPSSHPLPFLFYRFNWRHLSEKDSTKKIYNPQPGNEKYTHTNVGASTSADQRWQMWSYSSGVEHFAQLI